MQGDDMQDDRMQEALAPFFAAARRDAPPAPDTALLTRILADAAGIGAARAAVPERPTPPAQDGLAARLRRLFAPLGGLPAATALGACAVLGLTTGMMGAVDGSTAALWGTALAEDEPAAAVLAFYDLESPEG